MRLSIPFFKKKEEKIYYFCLYITDTFLSGFVLDVRQGREVIVADKKRPLTAHFDKLLEDTDALISDLELQSKINLDKTIFFLHSTMIDPSSHDIKEPYKGYIKKISQELELDPMGYIDVKEAIEDYIKNKSIMNCLLVELNKSEIGLFTYKGGALIQSEYAVRTQDVAADIQSSLASHPGQQVTPSKLIIYGDLDNTKAVSAIAQYNWDDKVFVQHPTIEALKDIELHQALAHSFIKELGSEGVVTEDIPAEDEQAAQSFGFMMGEDVVSSGAEKPDVHGERPTHEDAPVLAGKGMFSFLDPVFAVFADFFKPSRKANPQKKILIASVSIIVMALGGFLAFEYFFHKVTLKVYVQSQNVEEEFELELPITESASANTASLVKHVTVLDFQEDKSTTGSREIGEKAKGKVVIHNFDNNERTIERGTEIKYKELIYTLDSNVKVASSSGVTSDGTKQSGKETVSVTASEIGEEYNVPGGTQFTIGSLAESLFLGIADEAFSGGSKKKVNTVSKEDMDTLQASVEKKAEKQSSDVLSAKISKDELLISDLSEVTISDAVYSKELGEEADKVGIEAISDIEYYTIQKKSLVEELKKKLLEEQSKEYELDEKTILYSVEDVDSGKNEATIVVLTKANLYKKIDNNSLKSHVTLKPVSGLTEVLKDRFPVEKVEVDSTTVPFLNLWSPLFSKNITIETTSN